LLRESEHNENNVPSPYHVSRDTCLFLVRLDGMGMSPRGDP